MCQADCAVVAALSQPRPQAAQGPRPSARAAAAWATKWELAVPLVAIGALVSGLATPTESAALTAGYAVLTQALAHRELGWRLLGRCLADCAMPIGGVMLILGMALALANYLVDTRDLGAGGHSQQVRVSAAAVPVLVCCGGADGDLRGVGSAGAVAAATGSGLRHPPAALRHHLLGRHGGVSCARRRD